MVANLIDQTSTRDIYGAQVYAQTQVHFIFSYHHITMGYQSETTKEGSDAGTIA